ncbi:hypothetical protein P12x_000690 [Tundrisphaera lichenicola]|uniref:hypothetical protein n=1 Tax=Tundrisphaera lichenicola TaxID=2029860 RepID=UPI003EBE86DA
MTRRLGLTQIMTLIVVVAAGLGAMKAATNWMTGMAILSALVTLLVSTIGAIVSGRRTSWIGAAVFGWGYLAYCTLMAVLGTAEFTVDRRDRSNVWQFEGPAIELVLLIHPQFPWPKDPSPSRITNYDPATDLYTKDVGGAMVPFTTEEVRRQVNYKARSKAYEEQLQAGNNSLLIALTIQGMAFGLIGGAVGYALADQSNPLDLSPGTEPTTSPG